MGYKIPLFDLNFDEKEEQAVINTLRSKWISTGPKTVEFETLVTQMFKTKYAVAVSNCTVALHLALKLLGIGENDEVICPSLTFVATVNAILYLGAIPVFADISSFEDLTLNPDEIEKKVTSRTKAIIVMHYGGYACNMDAIMTIARKFNLKLVEDACHGPLAEYKGKKLGTIGDIGCFSFFSNKNISTGEGGMLVTSQTEVYEKARLLRSHGMTSLSYERSKGHSTSYDVIDLGYNYRMDDIRASIGIVQLSKLENDLKRRECIRNYYIERLSGIRGIIIPFKGFESFSSNYIFPVILENSTAIKRDGVRERLAKAGIQTSVHYPAVHRFSIYKKYKTCLPVTNYVTDNLITLPMYAALTKEQIDFICDCLSQLLT